MLTQKIDAALDAIDACRDKLPALVACYSPRSPERQVLERLLEAVIMVDATLLGPHAQAPSVARISDA